MKNKLEKIEVISFETIYDDGTLDFCTENIRSLCKAFSLIFRIIDHPQKDGDILRYYEIYLSASSFHLEDLRNVIKTFILIYGMRLRHVMTLEIAEDEYLDLCESAFEAGYQILDKLEK